MKTLFLSPPSFNRFDGAGTRFPATRKVKGMFYPVWLCYASGLINGSKVLDCPAEGIDVRDVVKIVNGYDLVIVYTTTPTVTNDLMISKNIKAVNVDIKIAFTGPHASVFSEELVKSPYVDFVARGEFDYTIAELSEGKELRTIIGLSWKRLGKIIHNSNRPIIEDLDSFPFVSKIYKRDLQISTYRLPQVLHPYVSIYTGRGCPYNCTFCLWPQTFMGRHYRTRSPQNVADEIDYIRNELPQVKEILFEDDTFTINPHRVTQICDLIKPMNITWSANARADVKYVTLKKMKNAGCRLLIVGFESGDQGILNNIKKGVTVEQMKQFAHDCHKLDIMVYGCFIIGLPGETKETIKKTLSLAKELDCDLLQCNVSMPLPGTELYDHCIQHGFLKSGPYLNDQGLQECLVEYPNLSAKEIIDAVDNFHVKFYYRGHYILKLLKQIIRDRRELNRILVSGIEFQKYILQRLIKRKPKSLKT